MIIVVGSVNIDFVVRTARLPRPGETVAGGQFLQAGGGKGANQAVAACRATSLPVALVAAVGDDPLGRAARDSFVSQGLLVDCLHVIPDTATGVALIMVDGQGENAISVAAGANACLTPAHIDAIPDQTFRACRVLLASLEVPRETVERALQRAAQFGVTTILNPAPADPAWGRPERLGLIDLLTPNESEAVLLAGSAELDPPACAAWLAAQAAPTSAIRSGRLTTVLLTQGAAGVSRFGSDPPQHYPARRVKAVDTTAAGDAFNGALAAALAEGQTLEAALPFAMTAAAISVTRPGAQPSLPLRSEVVAALVGGGGTERTEGSEGTVGN